jgi:Ser-tRNA(Ala) deacylase AlaX
VSTPELPNERAHHYRLYRYTPLNVSMIPESVSEIRVVDIVGLDKQADGGRMFVPRAKSVAFG